MMEVLDHKKGGLRFTAFANQLAIERVNEAVSRRSVEQRWTSVDHWIWKDVEPLLMSAEAVIATDEGEPEPRQAHSRPMGPMGPNPPDPTGEDIM
jgi:hypothetical protein